MLARMGSNWNTYILFVGSEMLRLLRKMVEYILINMHLPYDSEILLLGIYPRERKNYVHRKTWIRILAKVYS